MSRLGFTGTQEELPPAQARTLGLLLGSLKQGDFDVTSVHHGDCVGADAAFDRWCFALGFERHAHPGPDGPKRAYCEAEVVHEQRPFLDRNRDIVEICDLLIVCPRGPEIRRSGTWSTVRYARKVGRRMVFVWPDGRTTADPALEKRQVGS